MIPSSVQAGQLQEQANAIFAEGVAAHRDNRLEHALQCYEKTLRLAPRHFGALHHVGIIAIQTGNHEGGAGFLRSALAVNPDVAPAHLDLGNAYKELGQHEQALASYARALELGFDHPDLHYNRANALQAMARHEEALQAYDLALGGNPDDIEALNNRGTVLRALGRAADALASYDRALALDPQHLDLLNNRGNALKDLNRHGEAMACFDAALHVDPHSADAWFNRGVVEQARGEHEAALASYRRASGIDPQHARAFYQRSTVLHHLKRYDEALADCQQALALQQDYQEAYKSCATVLRALKHYATALGSADMAVRLKPDDAHAHDLRGTILKDMKRPLEALDAHEHALALAPDMNSAHQNRANALLDLKRFAEAEAGYSDAIALDPARPEPYLNRGTVHAAAGNYEAALADYDAAIERNPDMAGAYWNRSLLHLEHGRFKQGWIDHEWRWKTVHFENSIDQRDVALPLWRGQCLDGKTIVLGSEQGLGDTLQCARFAPMLAARGATVILEVQRALVDLLGTVDGVRQVLPRGAALPPADYWCPLMSVPLALGIEADTIPAFPRYLDSDPAKRAAWAQRLGPRSAPRVGLVWSGNPTHGNDASRSIVFEEFAAMLPPGLEYVSLMKDIRPSDAAALAARPDVRCFAEHLHDFTDTAALCDELDLVVSVDTSVAHLAGALGRPTWILLPLVVDWRWMRERSDSPWYPSARLLRQSGVNDWSAVRREVRAGLAALLEG